MTPTGVKRITQIYEADAQIIGHYRPIHVHCLPMHKSMETRVMSSDFQVTRLIFTGLDLLVGLNLETVSNKRIRKLYPTNELIKKT